MSDEALGKILPNSHDFTEYHSRATTPPSQARTLPGPNMAKNLQEYGIFLKIGKFFYCVGKRVRGYY